MLMSPEDISENFGEFHHCSNLKFENFGKSQLKIVSPRLNLGKLQGSLYVYAKFPVYDLHIVK